MPDMYVIVGEQDARESSTVRALTGAPRSRMWQVARSQRLGTFHVHISPLQVAGLSPHQFLALFPRENYPHAIISLRMSAMRRRGVSYPDAVDYLSIFSGHWRIRGIAVLGAAAPIGLPGGCPRPRIIQNAPRLASNTIAKLLRQTWHFD